MLLKIKSHTHCSNHVEINGLLHVLFFFFLRSTGFCNLYLMGKKRFIMCKNVGALKKVKGFNFIPKKQNKDG